MNDLTYEETLDKLRSNVLSSDDKNKLIKLLAHMSYNKNKEILNLYNYSDRYLGYYLAYATNIADQEMINR